MTMPTLLDPTPTECGESRVLLVLLPGANMSASDFVTHGFLRAVRRRGLPIDIIAVDTGVECYLDDDIADRLRNDIIIPACAERPNKKLWLGGISLGGFGALRYAIDYGQGVDGLLLLAPFLGSRGMIAEIEASGGLGHWEPSTMKHTTPQTRVLTWLQAYLLHGWRQPMLRLALGQNDRFSAAHNLLAAALPPAWVTRMPGGHDWETWESLWERILEADPFEPFLTVAAST